MFYKIVYFLLASLSIILWIFLFSSYLIFVWIFLCTFPPLIVYLFVYRREYWKWVRYFIFPSLTFLIIVATPIAAIFESISMSFNPINSLWRYEWIREKFWTDEYVKHFPTKIHKNAENVKFSFAPQFLQWGGHLILKEELIEEDFQKLFIFYKGNKNIDLKVLDFLFDSSSMIDIIDEDIKKYEIIILSAKPYEENNWNHGRASGVALWKENNSIIYWYEFW